MLQNTQVFDFEIKEEDMEALKNLPMLGYSGYTAADAPADAIANGED
jgi:predicted transcriptional regulator